MRATKKIKKTDYTCGNPRFSPASVRICCGSGPEALFLEILLPFGCIYISISYFF